MLGLVITASDTTHYDIAMKDRKLALLAPQGCLCEQNATKVIDAEGGNVMICRSLTGCSSFS